MLLVFIVVVIPRHNLGNSQVSVNRTIGPTLVLLSCRYDTGKDKFIDFDELKHMMEKLGAPQTHLSLKSMIREVDEDGDSKISFREVSKIIKSLLER